MQNTVSIKGTFLDNNKTCVRFSHSAANLGFIFDELLSCKEQVRKVVTTCFMTIKNLSKIRAYLSVSDLKTLVCSLILSRIDYCNSLYYGINSDVIGGLQSVQNSAAKLIYGKRKFDHVSGLISDLHWLKVNQRITFKILILVHNCLYVDNFVFPLKDLVVVLNKRGMILTIPNHFTSFGRRAFAFVGPKMWNSLPIGFRLDPSLQSFKGKLKHYLFNNFHAFSQVFNQI